MEIQQGVPEACRLQAAQLYMEGFRAKLAPVLGDDEQGVALLAQGLALEFCFAAFEGSALVGIAGIQSEEGSFSTLRPMMLIRAYGWRRGIRRIVRGLLMSRTVEPDVFLVAGITVAEGRRGAGIGAGLLRAIMEHAHALDYRTVALDVVDSNPDARRLYERLGFRALRTDQTAPWTRAMGYEAVTRMVKVL